MSEVQNNKIQIVLIMPLCGIGWMALNKEDFSGKIFHLWMHSAPTHPA